MQDKGPKKGINQNFYKIIIKKTKIGIKEKNLYEKEQ